MKSTFTYYNDPGHGWLAVPRSLVIELGIERQISPYSYQRGETVYLEEDRDAGIFIQRWNEANPGKDINTPARHANRESRIRNYADYRPEGLGWAWAREGYDGCWKQEGQA